MLHLRRSKGDLPLVLWCLVSRVSRQSGEIRDASQVPVGDPCQVVELARSGTRVAQLSATFGMTETTIYNWIKQDRIDNGELDGLSTDQALELAAAKKRIRQLETELAVTRKVNEIFLDQKLAPKACSR